MNSMILDLVSLFTGHSLWEYVTMFFDNVPKLIYLIYAAVASALDLLQCVMRKLAGLDTYWVDGQAYTQQDPVLEFIYGMLGIGRNAGAYSALSTVFWSFAIFGLIVLVIATMVAIIKSHYGEDANKTNPLSHIYTAIKAIFTFAITPAAVILGIYLSQFLLQTMDNITAGKATYDTIRGIYGDDAASKFRADDGVYTRYDFFGFGPKASSQTFSGMLFRVAAYDANRVRKGTYSVSVIKNATNNANYVFGATNVPMQGGTPDDEWVAYQIDYAFMNNLWFEGGIYAEALKFDGDWGPGDTLITIASVDFFSFVGRSEGFSKYNVGLVWYYYYLWNFNFFVGFASIMISFGLLTGIIIGLMARLIRTAALFLIFPPTLGLAPLDDWKAFKGWRTEFQSQILMAFGSIIGMNIFFLILPYVNEIDWFGVTALNDAGTGAAAVLGLPNYIMNTLIIIVGLLTIKSFIAFVSQLIGGADASATGEGLKKDLTSTLAKTGGAVLGAANIGMKVGSWYKEIGGKRHLAKKASAEVKQIDSDIAAREATLTSDADRATHMDSAATTMSDRIAAYESLSGGAKQAEYNAAMTRAEARAKAMGINTSAPAGSDDAKAWAQMKREAQDAFLSENDTSYAAAKKTIDNEGYTDADMETRRQIDEQKTRRQTLIQSNYLDKDGNYTKESSKQAGRQVGREIMGAIIKGLKEGTQDLTGINIGAVGGVFKRFGNTKYDKDGKPEGSYTLEKGEKGGLRASISHAKDTVFSASGGPRPKKPESGDDKLKASAADLSQVTLQLKQVVENLKRWRP